MTTPGLTPTGYVSRTVDDIRVAIETDEKATIDAGVDVAPTEPLGEINATFSGDLATVEASIAAVYVAQDPDNAVGQQLDVICAATGTLRKPATSTAVMISPTVATATSLANAVLDENGNVVTPGAVLAQVAGQTGLVFTNAIPVGPGGINQQLTTPWNPASGQSCVFIAMKTGAVPALAGTVTVISPSVAGLTSITNTQDGALGSDVETDDALRLRRLDELVPPDGATNDAIRRTLLAVKGTGPGFQGVINAYVFENDTNATDSRGLPAHSIMCVIWDNSGQANNDVIAQAILNSRSSAIFCYDGGTGLSGVAKYSDGRTKTIGFARATELDIWISITVAVDNTFDATNGPTAIAALLALYGNAIATMGVTLHPFPLLQPILAGKAPYAAIQGVRDVPAFTFDVHSSPVNTAPIPVTLLQMPKFSTARIVVSTTPFVP